MAETKPITQGLAAALGGLIRDQLRSVEERHQAALAQAWMDGAFCYGGDAAEQWYFNDGGADQNPYLESTP